MFRHSESIIKLIDSYSNIKKINPKRIYMTHANNKFEVIIFFEEKHLDYISLKYGYSLLALHEMALELYMAYKDNSIEVEVLTDDVCYNIESQCNYFKDKK